MNGKQSTIQLAGITAGYADRRIIAFPDLAAVEAVKRCISGAEYGIVRNSEPTD